MHVLVVCAWVCAQCVQLPTQALDPVSSFAHPLVSELGECFNLHASVSPTRGWRHEQSLILG